MISMIRTYEQENVFTVILSFLRVQIKKEKKAHESKKKMVLHTERAKYYLKKRKLEHSVNLDSIFAFYNFRFIFIQSSKYILSNTTVIRHR